MKLAIRLIKISIASAFLSACGNPGYIAPVEDFNQPPSKKLTTHHVARGETLYSIAWRYNLDYKKLAAANNLDSRYTIYPGQVLHLDTSNVVERTPAKPVTQHPKPAPKPIEKPPASVEKATPPSTQRSIKTTKSVTQKVNSGAEFTPKDWVWPANGKLITTFSSESALHKGIDISGDLGEPVIAAAVGTVVYSGDGLRGYGKLIIIKHSEKYLSAYAHNRRLLVAEGENVKMGQQIAEMGSTGTNRVKLHFEIRHDGKPVNPLSYLPKK